MPSARREQLAPARRVARRNRAHRYVGASLILASSVALASCSLPGTTSASASAPAPGSATGPTSVAPAADPRTAATAYAQGLSGADLGGVPLTDDPAVVASELTTALGSLVQVPRQVSVVDVAAPEADTQQTTATLHVSWQLPTTFPMPSETSSAAPSSSASSSASSSSVSSTPSATTTSADTKPIPWEYDTTLALVKDGSGWRASWAPVTLAKTLQRGERLGLGHVNGPRGDILDSKGAVIVTKRPVKRVGLDRSTMTAAQIPTAATALATAVGIDPASYVKAVTNAGPSAYVEAIVYRAEDPLGVKAIAATAKLPGIKVVDDTLALAPTRGFARPILGTVGQATAEMIAKSGGTLAAGDVVGIGGLQQAQNAILQGTPAVAVQAVSANGGRRNLEVFEGKPGQSLTTTLDVALQTKAEALLAKVVPASAIVAIRPSTGGIVAVASGPGSDGYSTATLGQYAPGSTFKVVSALALVRSGLTATTTVPCTDGITVDGRAFKNYDAYPAAKLGQVPFTVAFANSCNTAMIASAGRVSQADLAAAAGSLGLSATPQVGVPAYLGGVPDQASAVEHAASMIGQGRVQASPLGMATVAASVAAGKTVIPHLVQAPAVTSPSASNDNSPAGTPISAAESGALRTLMRAVVTQGSGTILAPLGPDVLAKTGTAEFGDGNPPATHAWMLGVKGDLAVAVFVDTGAGGAKTAGPILKAFLS